MSSRKKRKITKNIYIEDAIHDILMDWKIVQMKRQSDLTYKNALQHKKVAMAIAGRNQNMLKYLPQFADDAEVVYEAVVALEITSRYELKRLERTCHPSAFQYASKRLQHDRDFIDSLVEALSGEQNAESVVSKLHQYVPYEILEQIKPFSAELLERAVSEGRPKLVQTQIAGRRLNPNELAKLFSILLDQSPFTETYHQVMDLLVDLTDFLGQEYPPSLDFLAEEKQPALVLWLSENAKMDQFHVITSKLRGNGLFTQSLAETLCKEYMSRNPQTVGASVCLDKLETLMFGSPTLAVSYLEVLFREMIEKNVSRQLSFGGASSSSSEHTSAGESITRSEAVGRFVSHLLDRIFEVGPRSMKNVLSKLLSSAVSNGSLPITDIILKRVQPTTQLLECASNLEMTNLLLAHGADVDVRDDDGRTALHMAAQFGALETLQRLLQAHADINAQDKLGLTPLFVSAKDVETGCFEELLSRGADPNIEVGYDYCTVLYYALSSVDRSGLVRLLLHVDFDDQIKCNIYKKCGRTGNTYVHAAARSGLFDEQRQYNYFDLLHDAGADFNEKNNQGLTPLEYINDRRIAKYIIEYGGCGMVDASTFKMLSEIPMLYVVQLKTVEDQYTGEDEINSPVRCFPCKDVIGASSLHKWMNQHGQENNNKCPTCRRVIKQVEIMSPTVAARWDAVERLALKEEKEHDERKEELMNTPQFTTLVQKKENARKKLENAKQLLKESIHELKAVDDKIDEAKEPLNEDRRAVEAKVRALRDDRLLDLIINLKF